MTHYCLDDSLEQDLLPFLMESAHQGIAVINKDLEIIFFNETVIKMLEVSASVIQDDPRLESFFRYNALRGDYGEGDPEEKVRIRMEKYRRFEKLEYERKCGDGSTIRVQGTPLGEKGYVTIFTDVTKQRAYEARLQAIQVELEDKLEQSIREVRYNRDLLFNAINAIEDGLIIFDQDDNLVLANITMQDLYPALKRHLMSQSHISLIEGFELPEVGHNSPLVDMDLQAKGTEKKLHDDKWYRIVQFDTVNGGRIVIYSDISAYKTQNGKLQQHTNELVKLLQKEINLSETQREFVTMASHEFKTPLAIIDSNAQRIQRKIGVLPEEKLRERIGNIRDSVDRVQYLINRFMDFSSNEITGMKADAREQDFRAALHKICVDHFEMEDGDRIEWDLDALPERIFFDRTLLDQCFSNILSNALKYSPQDSFIQVIGKQDDRYIMIEVHDKGVGIPKSEVHKIFNKYFRASTSSGIAGTGIGLNFAQMALKEHGGHIEVKSEVGKGSCFTIFLPASLAEPDKPAKANTNEQPTKDDDSSKARQLAS
ncbi:Signal transduction histidine kinase [Cohaesibacter sp. ES.047]|uniref:sensor histidine kinase n=1 Tax=Cohaesibacter sp. ES.047 TaxID=1798205 RepID=UPI000BB9AC19|nr:PAS-domain containing protein [Cohaesibacter sp. ES.047]SNY90589.1 Signal transduction histidine kinase [Cohaesibacter sp. ES.047]